MRTAIAGLTVAAALTFAGEAAADMKILAVDGTAADNNNNHWAPSDVQVKVGETVTWSFAGTAIPHNVKSESSNWSLATQFQAAGPDAPYSFSTPGVYTFVCELHRLTMFGTVTVTDETGAPPPPPPPPPLSEQPFANDFPAPATLEVRDTVAPKLDRVAVTRVRKGARVRVRLSEAGKVAVKLTRGKAVKRRTVEVAKGTSSFTVSGLRAGTYRVDVTATDLAGNAAKPSKRARVTVRR